MKECEVLCNVQMEVSKEQVSLLGWNEKYERIKQT